MKKGMAVILVICLLFSVSGCAVLEDAASLLDPKEAVFTVERFPMQITADSTYRESTGGEFDLQITNRRSYISIMAYAYTDLPSGVTVMDVYDMQNEDLFSKRTAVTDIEEAKTQTTPQCVRTYALYSAEKDGVKNYYGTYMIDFPNEEIFAWVLFSATPSYFESNRDSLHSIVCSLTTTA